MAADEEPRSIMEQLCVTTAIIGLLAVSGKTIDSLYEMNTSPNRDTAILNKALQELKQSRSSIHILYKTFSLLEAGQLPFPERAAWIGIDDLVATLTDTVLAVSDLQAAMEPIELCRTPAERATMCIQFSQKLTSLSTRIRWHNLSMTMMMTILKCPGEQDAHNSQVGLERRMTRLLSSNRDLFIRMRRLRDIFGVRAMVRRAIPNHAPAAETAPRLPADRTSSSSSLSSSSTSGQQASPEIETAPAPPPQLWSIFSGYTLADIPVLSMIPIPVVTLELREGNELYTFDFAQRVSHDLVELMQLAPGQQGTSKLLRVILAKPAADLVPSAPLDAGTLSVDRAPLAPLAPDVATDPAPEPATNTTSTKKGFRNPLRHRIRRKKLK